MVFISGNVGVHEVCELLMKMRCSCDTHIVLLVCLHIPIDTAADRGQRPVPAST